MKTLRFVSIGGNSQVFHKPGCKYIHQMKPENCMPLSEAEAREAGYRICRCCNGMDFHMKTEKQAIDRYQKCRKMDFKYIGGILYVKTEISCWKLVYIRYMESIVIYHQNDTSIPLDFEHLEREKYHRQKDIFSRKEIEDCLYYIYHHDQYKAAVARGDKEIRFSSKKYEKSAKKVSRRRQQRRVDYLFRMLEKENKGYRELSFC